MEMDLAQLPNSGDPTLYAAFLNSMYLREIRVNIASPSESNLTDEGFPDLARLCLTGEEETEHPASYLMAGGDSSNTSLRHIRLPSSSRIDGIKIHHGCRYRSTHQACAEVETAGFDKM